MYPVPRSRIVGKEYIPEIEKYIDHHKQEYFKRSTVDGLKEAIWYHENLYPLIVGYLIVESLATKKLLHRMHNDHFLPLIPVHSIRIEKKKSAAWQAVSKVKQEYTEAIDKKIWTSWSKVEEILQFTESKKENAFLKFLDDYYFSLIEEECTNQKKIPSLRSNTFSNVKPCVEPEFEASEAECNSRKEILKAISAQQNTLA